jgi:spore photoproduct lyase
MRAWIPRRVLLTPSALQWPSGLAMVERAAAPGSQVVRLGSDRPSGLPDADRAAKTTMAAMRPTIEASLARRSPSTRVLYWP